MVENVCYLKSICWLKFEKCQQKQATFNQFVRELFDVTNENRSVATKRRKIFEINQQKFKVLSKIEEETDLSDLFVIIIVPTGIHEHTDTYSFAFFCVETKTMMT